VLESASDDEELNPSRLESFLQNFHGSMHEHSATAVKQIDSRVVVLGPSVNRVMRLLDDHRARDAIGPKFME